MTKWMKSLALLIALSVTGIASGSTGDQVHDGNWWLSVDKDQHLGFVDGYMDCYVFVRKGPLPFLESPYQYDERVTEHLKNHVADRGKPVTQILEAIAAKPPMTRITGKWGEKHGLYDGEFWRQTLPSGRVGFVQGFLECQRKDGKAVARFSRSDDWYVAQISRWYGIKEDDPAEINEKRESKKIADVLYTFKDKSTTTATAKKKP
jgi:hypothetical protein